MRQKFSPSFSHTDVEIAEHQVAYQGYFRIDKYRLRHRLFAGDWSNYFTREVFERGHAVAVLLFDPDRDNLVMIEQLRIGVLQQTDHPWLLELVAGIIDAGETKPDVARRETQEEAGLTLLDLIPICDYWVSPGGSTEKVAVFCGRVDSSAAGGLHGLAEENEDIRVWVLSRQEVYDLLAQGIINNAPSIIALQWLQLHEQEVRKKWSNQ